MRLPLTLSLYIGRRFLLMILYTVLALTLVAFLLDVVELLRRASGRDGVPFSAIMQMALLKTPSMLERLLPFAVLIGSLLALTRLTRTQELIIARAAGVSVWQFLAPALGVVLALGVFSAVLFNPLSSVMLLKFEKVEGRYLTGKPSLLSVSASGLWLRQVEEQGADHSGDMSEHIIYALRISQSDMSFSNVIIFSFDRAHRFAGRLDAASASLQPGRLVLSDVIRSLPGLPAENLPTFELPTDLSMEHIQDSFASPETISFWKLPSFIDVLENAGFSALKHRLYWHSLLAGPFLLVGMVLIGALFSLRLPRFGRISMLVTAGLFAGFFLYFFTNIIHTLGMAGTLPVALAAWAPAGIILMIGAGTLMHLEDG
jgi:lipopolysaccharide export system permease protein